MPRLMISLLAGAVALSGCAAVPDLGGKPQMRGPAQFATQSSLAAPAADWPSETWWTVYGDPQLDQLMSEALAGSPSLAQAAARVRGARARADEARGATLPSLGLNAQAAENKQSYNAGFPKAFVPQGYNDTGKATLDASFDLDLWGRNRAALAAATSEAEATLADAAQAKLLLTTNLAGAYADFVRLNAEHQAADAAARNRATSADLVARQLANGAANRGEADQARAAAAAARQDLAALDEQLAVARNRIAALTGRPAR
ncbi:TolC family protein, partial [Phenylobacterium aquaticum]|uniref:TolC family protein n=1 Tax=Phenylobacterium aquaticum TaxID=1763816 RepID=UPI001F5E0555